MSRLSTLLVILLSLYISSGPVHAQGNKLNYTQSSKKGIFNVAIYPLEARDVVIGQYHPWVITIKNKQNQPVNDARIAVGGGMEAHGHGLPSKPRVGKYLGDGKYLIEGLLFNMSGQWTLVFAIQTGDNLDQVRFDIDIAH